MHCNVPRLHESNIIQILLEGSMAHWHYIMRSSELFTQTLHALKDPYNFDCSSSPRMVPFTRTSNPGELKGSGRKQTATMAGVVRTIRKERTYHASFSNSADEMEVINNTCTCTCTFTCNFTCTCTCTCTFCTFRWPPAPGRRMRPPPSALSPRPPAPPPPGRSPRLSPPWRRTAW
jgi:hypothetical protein